MDLRKIKCSSINRLWSNLQDKTFAIITAYRFNDEEGNRISTKENIQRNRDLRAQLNDAHMGVYQLVGHWQEATSGVSYEEVEKKNKLTDVLHS